MIAATPGRVKERTLAGGAAHPAAGPSLAKPWRGRGTLARGGRVRRAGWGAGGRLLANRCGGVGGAVALFALGVLDAGFTAAYLTAELAREANPLMRAAWESSPLTFFTIKLAVTAFAGLLLVRFREHLATGLTLLGGLLAYSVVVGYHLAFLGTLLLFPLA